MGKKRAGKQQWNRKQKQQKTEGGGGPKQWRSLTDAERSNPKWEAYYKAQNIVAEREWSAFKESFLQELPIAFRFTTINGSAARLIERFEGGEFGDEATVYEADGRKFGAPTPIPWCAVPFPPFLGGAVAELISTAGIRTNAGGRWTLVRRTFARSKG